MGRTAQRAVRLVACSCSSRKGELLWLNCWSTRAASWPSCWSMLGVAACARRWNVAGGSAEWRAASERRRLEWHCGCNNCSSVGYLGQTRFCIKQEAREATLPSLLATTHWWTVADKLSPPHFLSSFGLWLNFVVKHSKRHEPEGRGRAVQDGCVWGSQESLYRL
jgi:hypothetical protein